MTISNLGRGRQYLVNKVKADKESSNDSQDQLSFNDHLVTFCCF